MSRSRSLGGSALLFALAALAAPATAGTPSFGLGAAAISPYAGPAGAPRERILADFQGGTDADDPGGGLALGPDGALYGYAQGGGTSNYGTIFKLTPSKGGYAESVIYTFTYPKDGYYPSGRLLLDAHGVIYGTAADGGLGSGVVFTLTPAAHGYAYAIIYGFQQSGDGALPVGGVIMDRSGALYGTTEFGGAWQAGTVYQLAPAAGGKGYRESLLYSFVGQFGMNAVGDGMYPVSGLTADASGALYGTTMQGGGPCVGGDSDGCGAVYKLTPAKSGYRESIIYRFASADQSGENPDAAVVLDGKGRLYGTAGVGIHLAGTVYRLTPSAGGYTEDTLYSFAGLRDGKAPSGSLTLGANGAIFGAATLGGDDPACTIQGGCGTVFKLTPQANGTYREASLYRFSGGKDGAFPRGPLLLHNGALIGVTGAGGSMNCTKELPGCGTVFSVLVP